MFNCPDSGPQAAPAPHNSGAKSSLQKTQLESVAPGSCPLTVQSKAVSGAPNRKPLEEADPRERSGATA